MRILSLLACFASCKACNPQVTPIFETGGDSGEREETGDSTDSVVDTAPPPLCEQVEVEPNDAGEDATVIAREREACGEFSGGLDLDWFEFETRAAGWIEIDIDAGERGSAADVNLSLVSEDDLALTIQDGAGSSDPYVLVPVPGADTWHLILNEERVQGGDEDFEYFFHVSEAKEPISYDGVEEEDHDGWETAQELAVGERVFAKIEETAERDWYVIHTPDDKTVLRAEVTAHRLGSPLDAKLVMWMESEEGGALADDWAEWTDTNPFDVGMDPAFERVGDGDTWYLQVFKSTGGAGPLYWYTIEVNEVSE